MRVAAEVLSSSKLMVSHVLRASFVKATGGQLVNILLASAVEEELYFHAGQVFLACNKYHFDIGISKK